MVRLKREELKRKKGQIISRENPNIFLLKLKGLRERYPGSAAKWGELYSNTMEAVIEVNDCVPMNFVVCIK